MSNNIITPYNSMYDRPSNPEEFNILAAIERGLELAEQYPKILEKAVNVTRDISTYFSTPAKPKQLFSDYLSSPNKFFSSSKSQAEKSAEHQSRVDRSRIQTCGANNVKNRLFERQHEAEIKSPFKFSSRFESMTKPDPLVTSFNNTHRSHAGSYGTLDSTRRAARREGILGGSVIKKRKVVKGGRGKAIRRLKRRSFKKIRGRKYRR